MSAMKSSFLLFALLAAAVSGPVAAQTSALKGLDTGAPIDVDAARIEIQDADNQAVFSGDVIITQGRMTLKADSVKVLYTRSTGTPEMQRLDARGNVRLVSPSETATGNTGIYDVNGKIVTLVGNVTLDRGGSSLKGQRLVLNLVSGQTSFDGRTGGTAATPGASPGRVTGRFVVPQRGTKP
ncbi:MAG: lipopolysaccharide transport periplasmic protein LptA [Alphaproteobacteria bacterium]|nr:MAG: lipopolysaccharide transport periplasmic protein LptA [Alphaproteobacteria bacterium]